MASYYFEVVVTVTRESGKFATRDEITEAIQAGLEGADFDLYGLGADGDSVYEVDEVVVELVGTLAEKRKR